MISTTLLSISPITIDRFARELTHQVEVVAEEQSIGTRREQLGRLEFFAVPKFNSVHFLKRQINARVSVLEFCFLCLPSLRLHLVTKRCFIERDRPKTRG